MQTRAAARRLAVAAATANDAVDASVTQTGAVEVPNITDAQAPPGNFPFTTKIIIKTGKRKRAGRRQAQPLKGGWVLPHGMGAGVASLETSSPPGDTAPPASSLATASVETEDPIQKDTTLPSQSGTKTTVVRQTRRTRASSQMTKTTNDDRNKDRKQEEPAIKMEESESVAIEKEDNRQNKRVRTALVLAKRASAATVPSNAALGLAGVKVEEKEVLKQLVPKLLIIKGITIRNNVVVKSSEKITVDAAQLLDPNLRRMVKRGKDNPYGLTPGFSPYPYRRVPTPDACEEVHRILTELHGEVKQPEKMPAASLEVAGCGEVPCVLDALLRTLISGNTLMALADAAIKNLAQHYGLRHEGTGAGSINWDKVRLSSHQELADAIKVAGNGPKRSHHIKQILDMVYEENIARAKERSSVTPTGAGEGSTGTVNAIHQPLSLDHMHSMSKDEAMAKFVSYPGIGIKTAACVTLFCLRMPCFAVDTHVHKFCRWLGWVPEKADPDNCFRHGDFMVPDHLKYGLHQLFIRHGQVCFKCRKATKPGTKDWNEAPDCPLEHLLDRSKDEAGTKAKQPKKIKEEASSGADDSGSDGVSDDGEEE